MKQCPVCYSQNVKEYKREGVAEICCRACGYDSGDKHHDKHRREQEREKERSR